MVEDAVGGLPEEAFIPLEFLVQHGRHRRRAMPSPLKPESRPAPHTHHFWRCRVRYGLLLAMKEAKGWRLLGARFPVH